MKPKIALHIIAVQRKLISERNHLQKGGSQLELAELDTFLRNEESIETLQREQGMNINDLNLAYHLQTPPKIHRGDLFQQGNIHISKHRRYAEVPEHTHDFVEINYMYSGTCLQIINGERIEMEESDVVIIDKEATLESDGSKHKECTVCKEVLETEKIAKLENKATVTSTVKKEEAKTATKAVKTGDNTNIIEVVCLLVFSLAVLTLVRKYC